MPHYLTLPLPRPEYFGGPEAMLTAIAWSAADVPAVVTPVGKKVGLAYFIPDDRTRPTTVHLEETYPSGAGVSGWESALAAAGIVDIDARSALAIAEGLKGVRPDKGFTVPATPLTKHSSLLQNSVGLARKANPFNVAVMFEAIYSLGAPLNENTSTVSGRWLRAMDERAENNPLLRIIDEAVRSNRLELIQEGFDWTSTERVDHGWGDLLSGATPFGWFYRSWNTLTSSEWVNALPPRVWIDWATGILRLGLGFAYLWESSFYERIGRLALVGELPADVAQLVDGVHEILPWRSQTESTSIRDVVSPMKGRIGRGNAIRDLMRDEVDSSIAGGGLRQLEEFAASKRGRNALQEALSTDSTKNVWEAVRYALASRSDSGSQADFYGMLRNAGSRYAVVEPGTEWTAMIAGLAAGKPKVPCTVADVRANLAGLGLFPELAELIGLLEDAGLARGSADADQAVEVQSPY